MTAIRRFLLSGIACTAGVVVSIGLAGPASAEPPSGFYDATLATSPSGENPLPSMRPWTVTPCGPGCVHVQTAGSTGYDLYDQGADTWTGTSTFKAETCQESLNSVSLIITSSCTDGGPATTTYVLLRKVG